MKVAAIDPGGTTGLAIAELVITPLEIRLRKKLLASLDLPDSVLDHIRMARCPIVIIEDQPIHGSLDGRRPFEIIYNELIRLGYKKNNKDIVGHSFLYAVNPGLWKPFVSARSPSLMDWEPQTQHEKDAMGLLYYHFRTHIPNKEAFLVL